MSVTIHRDAGFGGPYMQLGPGLYSGKDLVGCQHQSSMCEELDNATNSIRVDPGTVVVLAAGHAISARGASRVIIGPAEVPDLAALGMANRISSLLVVPFRAYDSAIPPPVDGVAVYDSYSRRGRRSVLRRGDYTAARLAAEETKMRMSDVASLELRQHTIAVLYAGAAFEADQDAVLVVGPTALDDFDNLGMTGRVGSIRVLYTDPFDTIGRPTVPLGVARAYTPGGLAGWSAGGPEEGGAAYTMLRARAAVREATEAAEEAAAREAAAAESAEQERARAALRAHQRRARWGFQIVLLFILLVLCAAVAAYYASARPRNSGPEFRT